jgi:cytochrome d ubiquinol oxidase subunit II
MDLNTFWFLIVTAILTIYFILDGFDLGIGILHIFVGNEDKQKALLNMIGPHWDGNEVWLIVLGGVVFAVFPKVYAAVLSGFYLPVITLLVALIFRGIAVSMQYSSSSYLWRRFWSICFGAASFVIVLLFAVVLGNLVAGVPMNENGTFRSGFAQSLNFKTVWVAALAVVLIIMHGTIYAAIKIPIQWRANISNWAFGAWLLTTLFVIPAVVLKIIDYRVDADGIYPILFVFLVFLIFASLSVVPFLLRSDRYFLAFITSSLLIASLIVFFAVHLFPRIIVSSLNASYSLTIYNACATDTSTKIMLIIAGIGIPVVIAYSAYAYWVLEHKMKKTGGY